MVEWDEPFTMEPLTNLRCSITREDAIKAQRSFGLARPVPYVYKTDKQALEDFITVRWAVDTEGEIE